MEIPTLDVTQSYLVTGGTGFLGTHLIPIIVSNGYAVRLYCRTQPTDDTELPKGVTVIIGSLTDEKLLARAAEGCVGIFHLAGMVVHSRTYDTEAMRECNVDGTLYVLR
jgi:nucleoside-diphosphate-sugar epimerase